MHKLVVSAPFGNYFNIPHTTSTLGTYTREFRAGPLKRAWRVFSTVRYYPGIKAFKNKLGLPNPGIEHLERMVMSGQVDIADKILSISARNTDGWLSLLLCYCDSMKPGYIELNVSCPNCPTETDESDYQKVFTLAAKDFPDRSIVKLPPVGYMPIARRAFDCGITCFHGCNTIYTPGGGMSGAPLKMFSLQAVANVRELADRGGYTLHKMIGGGGVKCRADADDYIKAGATNVAVASSLFFPWRWPTIWRLARDLDDRHGQ